MIHFILNIIGNFLTASCSLIGLTKPAKSETGSLTKYGERLKAGIIIGVIITVANTSIESYQKSQEKPINVNMLEYPIQDLYGYAVCNVPSSTFKKFHYIDSAKVIYYNLQKNPLLSYKNGYYTVSGIYYPPIIPALYYFKLDSIGKPKFIALPPDSVRNNLGYFADIITDGLSNEIYFTKDNDFLKIGLQNLKKWNFDLVYSYSFVDFPQIRYYPEQDLYQFDIKLKMTVISSNGKLKSLQDLSDCYAVTEAGNINVITSLTSISQGYTLNKKYFEGLRPLENNTNSLKNHKKALSYIVEQFSLNVNSINIQDHPKQIYQHEDHVIIQ
jgi:hypothetical protein